MISFSNFCHLNRYAGVSHMVLICISLMTSDSVYLFIYLFTIYRIFSKVSNLFPFLICKFFDCLIWIFFFFCLIWILRVLCTSPVSAVWVQTFSHSGASLFVFLAMSFKEQKLLTFIFFNFLKFFGCVGSSLLRTGFPLVAASGGYSSLRCTGSRHTGFSSCGTQAQ